MFVDIHTHSLIPCSDHSLCIRSLDSATYSVEELSTLDTPFSVGIHPWHLPLDLDLAVQTLSAQATQPNCLAIGECGLDKLSPTPYAEQRKVFQLQLQLAQQLSKPVILHMVRSAQDILIDLGAYASPPRSIVHGFRGAREQAHQLIRKGLILSFGQYFHPEALRLAYDLGALLLETDEASLSISQIYQNASASMCIPIEEVKERVYRLFFDLFL